MVIYLPTQSVDEEPALDELTPVSRQPEAHRQEVWRIYETAEQHLVAVVSNSPEGNTDESN